MPSSRSPKESPRRFSSPMTYLAGGAELPRARRQSPLRPRPVGGPPPLQCADRRSERLRLSRGGPAALRGRGIRRRRPRHVDRREAGESQLRLGGDRPLFLRRDGGGAGEKPQAIGARENWKSPISTIPISRTGLLRVEPLGRGFAWFDAGTHASLLEASEFIRVVQKRQRFSSSPRRRRSPTRPDGSARMISGASPPRWARASTAAAFSPWSTARPPHREIRLPSRRMARRRSFNEG